MKYDIPWELFSFIPYVLLEKGHDCQFTHVIGMNRLFIRPETCESVALLFYVATNVAIVGNGFTALNREYIETPHLISPILI